MTALKHLLEASAAYALAGLVMVGIALWAVLWSPIILGLWIFEQIELWRARNGNR